MADIEIGTATIKIVGDTTGFAQDVDKKTTDQGKKTGSKFSKVLGGALKGGAIGIGAGVAGIIGVGLAKGFSRLNSIDQAKAKLTGLGNSAGKVEKIMDNALTSVKGTAFGLDEAASQAATLVAAGIKPGQQLTKTLKLVGDTATITGDSFGNIGTIFAKVAGSGKLTGESLAQLSERGIPVLQKLADHYKISTDEAQKMVSSGKVSFKDFQAVMGETLGGAGLESGKTFSGGLANMQAALGRLGASVLKGVFSKLPSVFASITKALDALGPAAEKVGAILGGAFSFAVDAVTKFFNNPAIKGGLTNAFFALQRVFEDVKAAVGPLFDTLQSETGGVLPKIIAMFGTLSSAIVPVFDLLSVYAKNFGAILAAVFPVIMQAINALLPILGALAAFFVSQVLPAVTAVVSYVMSALVPVFVQVVGVISKLIPVVQTVAMFFITQLLPAIMAIVTSVVSNLKPVFDQLVATFQAKLLPLLTQVIAKFQEWWPTISKVIMVLTQIIGVILKVTAWLLGKLLPPIITIVAWLAVHLVGAIVKTISALIKIIGFIFKVGAAFVAGAQNVGQFVSEIGSKIGDAVAKVKELPAKVKGALSGAVGWLKQAGRDIIQGLINGLQEAGTKIAGVLVGLLPGPLKKFANKLGLASPSKLFKTYGKWVVEGFVIGITSGEDDVGEAMTKMADNLAKKGEKGASKIVKSFRSRLIPLGNALAGVKEQLTAALDDLNSKIEQSRNFAGSVANSLIKSVFMGEDATFGGIVDQLKAQAKTANDFALALLDLKNLGLNNTSFEQIASAGPDALAAAQALIEAGKAGVDEVNSIQGSIMQSATTAGEVAATTLYQAGINGAQGLVDGLIAQQSTIEAIMANIANQMISKVGAVVNASKGGLTYKAPAKPKKKKVAKHASGTMDAPGGWSLVGEQGPELIDLPPHSKVYTAGQTAGMLGGGTTYGDIHVTLSIDDVAAMNKLSDFLAMLDGARVNARQTARSGTVSA